MCQDSRAIVLEDDSGLNCNRNLTPLKGRLPNPERPKRCRFSPDYPPMGIPARVHWSPPLGTWKPVKTAHAGGMKANRLRWVLLCLLGGVVFRLPAQQSEADGKLL